jgi:hypothetical protein
MDHSTRFFKAGCGTGRSVHVASALGALGDALRVSRRSPLISIVWVVPAFLGGCVTQEMAQPERDNFYTGINRTFLKDTTLSSSPRAPLPVL